MSEDESADGEAPREITDEAPETIADDPPETIADDPAWRLTAWLLPAGAGATALLTVGETLGGGLDGLVGYPATLMLALLCAALLRDARRRAASGRWVRVEAYEYALPLGLFVVTLVLLARGANVITCVPALLTLLPVAWEIVHAPAAARVRRLFPYALPMLLDDQPEASVDEVEEIVRAVLDELPPDIAARLEGWSVEVREEMLPQPPDSIVFGCCFMDAHVIAIYRRPHLRYHRRGEPLREQVTYTVLHEIAHALGLDEIGVRRLGWLASAPRPGGG